ncbi:MAG: hypothetical protein HN936_13610, partial [Bacteroidetes bacterium]|nr:hypothetical protein [Bacteroidota bacterium]
MDRKSLIGLLLIGGLLIAYSIWTRPSKEEIAANQFRRDSIQQVEFDRKLEALKVQQEQDSIAQKETSSTNNDLKQDNRERELGSFAALAEGEEKYITLENDKLRILISNKGGQIYSVELKEYQSWDKQALILFEGGDHEFNLKFFADNKAIATQNLFFVPQSNVDQLDATNRKQSIAMRLQAGDGKYMDFVYSLEPESYRLGFEIKMNGMDQVLGRANPFIDLDWSYPLKQQERGAKFEGQYSNIYYKYFEDEVG